MVSGGEPPALRGTSTMRVISFLRPEFIAPQDGHDKQDCEIAAARRWLDKEAARCLSGLNHNVTYLGDDIYAHQPFCRRVLRQRSHFIFTCKPDSHTYLYQWIGLLVSPSPFDTFHLLLSSSRLDCRGGLPQDTAA